MPFANNPKIKDIKIQNINVLQYFKSSLILVLATLALIAVSVLFTIRVQKIAGTEVGIKLNKITGEIGVVTRAGTYIYNGIISSFYVLDKTVQKLEMVAQVDRGDRMGRDDLRFKTNDGSNVYLDLTINYKILLDPASIEQIVKNSGPGDAYKYKWVRDYSRSICRSIFGELTTEQFYDAALRSAKAEKAREVLNELLKPHGIGIISIVAKNFKFHDDYEAKIKEKKEADQEVEKQKSLANAALQQQKFREVEAEKKKDVAVAVYKGQMAQLLVQADAEAEKVKNEAEAYAVKTNLGADAQYYTMEKNALAIEFKKKTEAEGTAKMAEALSGEGGRNIVKMEYAKHLQNMTITGQPYTIEGKTERFTHVQESAASKGRSAAAEK